MATPASIHGHPFHVMLVPIPIGLLLFSLVCDLIVQMSWGGLVWNDLAWYTMAGGVVGALVAALPGFIDLTAIRDPKTRSIGLWHMSVSLALLVDYAIDLALRMFMSPEAALPLVLSVAGVLLLGTAGWLGGELVYVRGVGIGADLLPDKSGHVETTRQLDWALHLPEQGR